MVSILIIVSLGVVVNCGVISNYNIDENCPQDVIFHEVRVTDCDQLPCTFYRERKYYVAETDIGVLRNTSKADLVCSTVYLGRHVEWTDDACEQLSSGSCPFTVDEKYTLSWRFKVPYYVPPRSYTIYCNLLDDNGESMICPFGTGRIV